MDTERIKVLIGQREAIDAEIVAIVTSSRKERKQPQCSKCGSQEHTARNCTAAE